MKIKSSILVGLISLCALFSPVKSELKDITKPYLGQYTCQKATLAGFSVKDKFRFIRLELKKDGTFLLSYQKNKGKTVEEQGKYEYDSDRETIRIIGDKRFDREFPIKQGVIYAQIKFGVGNLVMEFKQE